MHPRCAAIFYKWSKGVKTFDKRKFRTHHFKFFCFSCKHDSCHFCEKKHNIGEDSSFLVMCSEGHWLAVSKKCAPNNFKGATTKTTWFCKKHSVKEEEEKAEEEAVDENENVLPTPEFILEKMGVVLPIEAHDNRSFPPYDKIRKWSKPKKKRPLTFFYKLKAKEGKGIRKWR